MLNTSMPRGSAFPTNPTISIRLYASSTRLILVRPSTLTPSLPDNPAHFPLSVYLPPTHASTNNIPPSFPTYYTPSQQQSSVPARQDHQPTPPSVYLVVPDHHPIPSHPIYISLPRHTANRKTTTGYLPACLPLTELPATHIHTQ